MINHFALNLVTKGLLNISNVTKGMIIVGYEIVKHPHGAGGGGAYAGGMPYRRVEDEREFYEDIKRTEDIDVIRVKIDWKRKYKGNKNIEARLIKERIEAKILQKTGKKITVEIIGDEEKVND
jgi:hypothetical protein